MSYCGKAQGVRTDAGRREASTGSEYLINDGHETKQGQGEQNDINADGEETEEVTDIWEAINKVKESR